MAKALFVEIAEDLAAYRRGLESRREKLLDAKQDLGRHPGVSEAVKVCIEGAICDPVCGMRVDESKSEYTSTYKGKKYFFCSNDCKKAFDFAPEKHMKG